MTTWRAPAIALGIIACAYAANPVFAQTVDTGGSGVNIRSSLDAREEDSVLEVELADLPPRARPTAAALRIDTTEAPIIDADLSDPAWANATLIEDFRQIEPDVGAPVTEPTELRIMYDENNLYFGIYAYDSAPADIVMRSMERDGPLWTGDMVDLRLDPGLTRRNAYYFLIGPSGGRGDSLLLNNTDELAEWDIIWTARARIVDDGWIAGLTAPVIEST